MRRIRWQSMRRVVTLVAVAVTTMTLACCGVLPTASASAHVKAPARTAIHRVVAFRVDRVHAGTVAVPDGHPTLVYFMSTQCGSCVAGEQQLAELRHRMPQAMHLVSLDVAPGYDTPAMVLAMAREVGAHWPQAYARQSVINRYHITALDEVVIMNAEGRVIYDAGLPSDARILQLVHKAV